jgi:hypothetical protein
VLPAENSPDLNYLLLLLRSPRLWLTSLLLVLLCARQSASTAKQVDLATAALAWSSLAMMCLLIPRMVYRLLLLLSALLSLLALPLRRATWRLPNLMLPLLVSAMSPLWEAGVDRLPLAVASQVSTRPAEDAATLLSQLGTHCPAALPVHFRNWLAMSLYNVPADDPETQRVLDRISNSTASSTRSGARTVMNHVSKRAGIPPLQLLQSFPHVISSNLMVELEYLIANDKIALSTAASYADQAYQILRRTPGVPKENLDELKIFTKGLNKSGAKIPLRQAPPITKEQFLTLLAHPTVRDNLPLRAVLFVSWKTCSRIDESRRLQRGLKRIAEQELLLEWGSATKTSALNPFAPRFKTVLSWAHYDSTIPDPELLSYLTTGSGTLAPGMKTSDVARTLKLVLGNNQLGGHSIKRGSLDHVWSLKEDPPPMEAIEMVAKHQSPKNAPLGETHLRYLTGSTANAVRRMNSHLVTRRL